MTTKVFFNESCKICKKEIDLYKKMENDLSWVDIHQQEAKVTNLDTDQLSRRLHVLDDGKLYSGAKAFLIVWSRIPKLKILNKIFSLPIIFQVFHLFYEIIAYFLYLKNKAFSK
jgi:predicted DCC family thiol-disulfide oxidoreductase YuxK